MNVMLLSADRDKPPREVAWDAAYTARMNAVYYESLIRKLERRELSMRILSAVLASGGIVAAVEYLGQPAVAVIIGLIVSALSVVSPLLSYPERIKRAATILPRYVRLNHTFARLFQSRGEELTFDEMREALDEFAETEVLEAEKIRTTDPKLVRKAEAVARAEMGATPVPLQT